MAFATSTESVAIKRLLLVGVEVNVAVTEEVAEVLLCFCTCAKAIRYVRKKQIEDRTFWASIVLLGLYCITAR